MKLLFLSVLSLFGLALVASGQVSPAVDWRKVVLTRSADDVKGFTRVGEVRAKAQKMFGSPDGLRERAREQLRKEAAKQGATYVFIEQDEFQATPINNVCLVGTAYNPPTASTPAAQAPVVAPAASPSTPVVWTEVIVTRNRNEVAQMTKAGEVKAKAQKMFGSPDSLRAKAINELKQKAAAMGGRVVVIELEDFQATPINNVVMEGTVYR